MFWPIAPERPSRVRIQGTRMRTRDEAETAANSTGTQSAKGVQQKCKGRRPYRAPAVKHSLIR